MACLLNSPKRHRTIFLSLCEYREVKDRSVLLETKKEYRKIILFKNANVSGVLNIVKLILYLKKIDQIISKKYIIG